MDRLQNVRDITAVRRDDERQRIEEQRIADLAALARTERFRQRAKRVLRVENRSHDLHRASGYASNGCNSPS